MRLHRPRSRIAFSRTQAGPENDCPRAASIRPIGAGVCRCPRVRRRRGRRLRAAPAVAANSDVRRRRPPRVRARCGDVHADLLRARGSLARIHSRICRRIARLRRLRISPRRLAVRSHRDRMDRGRGPSVDGTQKPTSVDAEMHECKNAEMHIDRSAFGVFVTRDLRGSHFCIPAFMHSCINACRSARSVRIEHSCRFMS